MDTFITFANDIIDFINNLPNKSDSYWERIILWVLISYLEMKLYMLEIAYGFASALVQSIGLSSAISSAWGAVPLQFQSVFVYLRVPDAINMIMSAYVTRFVLGLMP
jgi:hypothetical protein